MGMRFNEVKATQIAARLLQRRGTGRMSYLKLIKLMYLIDREALAGWGKTVSTDHHVSMNKGPVLSNVYRLINEEPTDVEFWVRHISRVPNFDIELIKDPGDDELSAAEDSLIARVFAEHGHKSRWQLVDELHRVPEWRDPHGSMVPIELADILSAVGRNEDDIRNIEEQIEAETLAAELFQPA